MSGKQFDLNDNNAILKINSPKMNVGGPYKVVYKNLNERWVIVALDWDNEPRLGIRWFWNNGGNPFSSGHPIWLVIPSSLSNSILNGLPISFKLLYRIRGFLSGNIAGNKL